VRVCSHTSIGLDLRPCAVSRKPLLDGVTVLVTERQVRVMRYAS
jgi:hypothetical protein